MFLQQSAMWKMLTAELLQNKDDNRLKGHSLSSQASVLPTGEREGGMKFGALHVSDDLIWSNNPERMKLALQ